MPSPGTSLSKGLQARVRGQSEREDLPLLPLQAEPTPDTSSNGMRLNAPRARVHKKNGSTKCSLADLEGEITSDRESENPGELQSLRIENGTSDGSIASSSAALRKICGCRNINSFNKCRSTQSDGGNRVSSEDLSTDILDNETYKMHIKLRTAIWTYDLTQVKQLLAEGVSPTHLLDTETALHYCIRMYGRYSLDEDTEVNNIGMKIVEEILAEAVRYGAVDAPNEAGETPLHFAITLGNLKSVEALVKAGARMEYISNDGSTALHVAARTLRATLVLKYFLDNHNIPMSLDRHSLTPYHYAVKFNNLPGLELFLKQMKQQEIPKLLTSVDKQGRTLVYVSADSGHVEMTIFLLRNGGTLSVEGEKDTVIRAVYGGTCTVDSINFFQNLFDEYVDDKIEYKVFGSERSHIVVLEDMVKYGYRKLLKHPLVESLIYLKWKCLLPVFRTIIFTYVAFLLLFNLFITTTFIKKEDKKNGTFTTHPENNGTLRSGAKTIDSTLFVESYGWYPVIYTAIFVLLAQECMWIHLQRRRYFKRFESYVTLSALVLAAAVPLAVSFAAPAPARHVACAALLLVWLRPLFILSRIPGWGHYVLMLKIVAINISKIFAMLGCLVVGFAICFMIQYQLEPPFNNVGDAIIKTLVMMSSEFDFEDLFGVTHAVTDADAFTAVMVRLLFVAFVILIATVMMNLMIGVAVSDANELAAIGNIMALEMQVELLSSLEGVENLIPWKWSRKLSRIQHHDYIYNIHFDKKLWLVLSNRNPYSYVEIFDSKLHNDICELAKKNLDKKEESMKSNNNLGSLDSTTLEDRWKIDENVIEANKAIKEVNKEVQEAKKEVIEANKEIVAAKKDIEKSINDLKKDMNKILVTSVMRLPRNRKVVSTKLGLQKRKKPAKCELDSRTEGSGL